MLNAYNPRWKTGAPKSLFPVIVLAIRPFVIGATLSYAGKKDTIVSIAPFRNALESYELLSFDRVGWVLIGYYVWLISLTSYYFSDIIVSKQSTIRHTYYLLSIEKEGSEYVKEELLFER